MLQEIIDDWIASAPQNETDDELGHALLALVQILSQLRHTPCPTPDEQERLFTLIVKRLSAARLGPKYSIPEAILRRLSEDPGDAVRYLSRHLATQSEQQSRRAQSPRPQRRDAITRYIEELIEGSPLVTANEILNNIKSDKDFLVDEFEVRHRLSHDVATVKSFRSRVTNARKRILNGGEG
jgi:hypothetical protein